VGALSSERILLGVSGGIAAYKAAELVRRLREDGAQVRVVMTAGAAHFVGATTFQALSGHPVRSSLWDDAAEAAMGHIELARWASRILIAPASADLIARLAQGQADDLLTTLCLASEAPLAIAPAMNRVMWMHPATRSNVERLRARGVAVFGPAAGEQACGETGEGRMLEPEQLRELLHAQAAPPLLRGRRLLVSAGPTYEDIDPVRYLGNRSSGRMGFALAEQARLLGAEVTLVAGPVSLPTPAGVRRIDVRSAAQLREAVLAALPGQDAYLGAAAVADYTPRQRAHHKLKKTEPGLSLELVRTADVLAEVAAHAARPRLVVGFAAETGDLEACARDKLERKRLDLVCANDVSAPGLGFDSERNALLVLAGDGRWSLGPADKSALARELLTLVATRLGTGA
jgi:phosphopantothenoylcysteine decarboxylase/phosphopantothenate--cysteine ligase